MGRFPRLTWGAPPLHSRPVRISSGDFHAGTGQARAGKATPALAPYADLSLARDDGDVDRPSRDGTGAFGRNLARRVVADRHRHGRCAIRSVLYRRALAAGPARAVRFRVVARLSFA